MLRRAGKSDLRVNARYGAAEAGGETRWMRLFLISARKKRPLSLRAMETMSPTASVRTCTLPVSYDLVISPDAKV